MVTPKQSRTEMAFVRVRISLRSCTRLGCNTGDYS